MSTDDTDSGTAPRPSFPDTGDWIVITDRKVYDSRISIPDRVAERHGIEEAQRYDVLVRKKPGVEAYFPDTRVQTRIRLGLSPQERVTKFGLEGDIVDIMVRQWDE